MFDSAFKYVDDVLYKEAGCNTELDYAEQSSWVLFLKYLDDRESDRESTALLTNKPYKPLLEEPYRWRSWAAPKTAAGDIDLNNALTGDDLVDFVEKTLWPYLASFKRSATSPDTLEYKIGEIFSEIDNKIASGYNLREIIDRFDELRFGSAAERHELSSLYEDRIKNMGNAGRNGGQYYTPRPLIKAIVKIVDPKVGETVLDPAVGSAGFLCEAFDYMKSSKDLSTEELETLQDSTFYGREVKSLAYIIGIMNMILHGIEAPNIVHTNALAQNVMEIQEKDRYDVVIANPPFGGKERKEVQQNFPIRSGETAYLFMQLFIRSLKAGGRAGVVIKNTFLSNGDAAALRKELLETCSLDIVLDCPAGTFTGTGVKTVVLFFTKGKPTKDIWYYQLDPGRKLGKTSPLNDADMEDFLTLAVGREDSENSWTVSVDSVDEKTLDLSVKNPNKVEEVDDRTPAEILDEIERLDRESAEILAKLRSLL
ncbi:type I restriction-modification system subunit M [bacterium]|nr:type I restriction-modification system subunit M [bacterium]